MTNSDSKLKWIAEKGKLQLDILRMLQANGLRGIISGPVGANIPRIAVLAGIVPRTDIGGDGSKVLGFDTPETAEAAQGLKSEALQGLFDATDCYLGLDKTGQVWATTNKFVQYTSTYMSEQHENIEILMRIVGKTMGLSVKALTKPSLYRLGVGLNEATYEFYKNNMGKDTLMLRLTVGECLEDGWQGRLANGSNNLYYGIGKSAEMGDNGEVILVPWGTTNNLMNAGWASGFDMMGPNPCYMAVLGYAGLAVEAIEFIHEDTAATVLSQLVMQTYSSAMNPVYYNGNKLFPRMLHPAIEYLIARGTVLSERDVQNKTYLASWAMRAQISGERTDDILNAMGQANGFACRQFKSNENLRMWKFCLGFWDCCFDAVTQLGKRVQLSMAIKQQTGELFVAEYSPKDGYLPLKSYKCSNF